MLYLIRREISTLVGFSQGGGERGGWGWMGGEDGRRGWEERMGGEDGKRGRDQRVESREGRGGGGGKGKRKMDFVFEWRVFL